MDAVDAPSRRSLLRGTAAMGAGIATVALPSAAAAASTTFVTGLGDPSLALYVDTTNASSWPGTGSTWTDLTGNGHALSVGGTDQPTFTTDGLGITGGTGAFAFDGVEGVTGDGVVPAGALPAFAFGPAWTIAAWLRFSSLTGWQTIVGQGDRPDNGLFFQKVAHDLVGSQRADQGPDRAANQLGVVLERGSGHRLQCFSTTVAQTGTWYHLVATADAFSVRTYVNGALEATAVTEETYDGSLKPATASISTFVGSSRLGRTNNPFNGALPFLQIWTRALTGTEVLDQYTATRAPYHPV